MNKRLSLNNLRGFTLIEMLVVIAIIAILAAILIPAIQNALFDGAVTQTVSNGRSIYVSAFAKALDNVVIRDSSLVDWPKSESTDPDDPIFTTSTDFFKYLVEQKIMTVPFSFFAAKGIKPAVGSDPNDFTEVNNAWRMVANFSDETSDGLPFLFTKNLDVNDLGENPDLRESIPATAKPFGNKALVVVTKGGSSFALQDEAIKYENFISVSTDADGIDEAVVLPP